MFINVALKSNNFPTKTSEKLNNLDYFKVSHSYQIELHCGLEHKASIVTYIREIGAGFVLGVGCLRRVGAAGVGLACRS